MPLTDVVKRRGFLGLCGAVLLTPFVPVPLAELPPPGEWTIQRLKNARFDLRNPRTTIGGDTPTMIAYRRWRNGGPCP
jgi:hypothetical protein